jgi:hypothetical protein
MNFVLLPFQPPEKALDAVVVVAALDHETPLLVGQIVPRHVETQTRRPGGPLQLRQTAAIVRLAPGFDRAGVDRLAAIGHDEIHVELDDVAEAMTGRARAERVIEREEPRLRHFVRDAARAAFESLAEPVRRHRRPRVIDFDGKCRAIAFVKGRLDRVGQARPDIGRDAEPIDDHSQ